MNVATKEESEDKIKVIGFCVYEPPLNIHPLKIELESAVAVTVTAFPGV